MLVLVPLTTLAAPHPTNAPGYVGIDDDRLGVENDICCRRERHFVQVGIGEFVVRSSMLVC